MSKILIAVSHVGSLKQYMVEPFTNWLKKEVEPIEGVEIMVYGDRPLADFPFHPVEVGGNGWADDVIWATHEAALETARNYNFDAVVFQGTDCITTKPGDYKKFLEYAGGPFDIIAPVQMGRKEPLYPVVRDWKIEQDIRPLGVGPGYLTREYISSKQEDVSAAFLTGFSSTGIIECGFPGTEMCLINKQCFNIPIANPEYRMWYKTNDPRDYLCVHEFFLLNCARAGHQAWVDTHIETAHCDDSGMAAISLKNPVPNEEVFKIWR